MSDNPTNVNTGGGASIGGDANPGGDFIGRDQIIIYETAKAPSYQLPERVPHFTDRKTALKELVDALQPQQTVTLCGAGGIGKTSLAIEALHALHRTGELTERFPGGVIVHNFYAQPKIVDTGLLIAKSLGEDPGQNPLAAAKLALGRTPVLLLLDGAEDADDLPTLLQIRGQAGILITTRDRRRTENRRDLPPLSDADAVTLLQKWSGSEDPAAQRIAELVGGLPLALVLVGSYLDETQETATEYLARLEETPLASLHLEERRDASADFLLAETYERLSPIAQTTLAVIGWLAPTSFDRSTIAAALDIDNPSPALNELVRYSLLQRNLDGRYTITHRLIHTYATRRLIAHHPDALSRLTAYFIALAEEHVPQGLAGYQRLDPDLQHILTMLGHCEEAALHDPARRLVWTIHGYFDVGYGYTTDRITTLKVGLAAAQSLNDRQDEGIFLSYLGVAHENLGQTRQAIGFHAQASVIACEIGHRQLESNTLGNLGNAYRALRQFERAIKYYEQTLAIARKIGNRQNEGTALGNLSTIYGDLGQVEQTIDYSEQALAIAREIHDYAGESRHLCNLGTAHANLGHIEQAIDYHAQALVIAREIGNRRNEALCLHGLGGDYQTLNQPNRARLYLKQALAILVEIESPNADVTRQALARLDAP